MGEFSVIARRVSETNATKQSISATFESPENFLLYANLWLDLLIRFWVIYFLYLLTTRDLDCFGLFQSLAMTEWADSILQHCVNLIFRFAWFWILRCKLRFSLSMTMCGQILAMSIHSQFTQIKMRNSHLIDFLHKFRA